MRYLLLTTMTIVFGLFSVGIMYAQSDLVITGVFDGPLSGGTPKGIEVYVINDISDLSIYGIGSATNGGGSDGEEFTFPADMATAGDFLYVANEGSNAGSFSSFFGFAPDYTAGSAAINGDDPIELFMNGSVVDVFGDINTDGTGEPWEYTDGWAYRVSSTGPDGSTWTLANWSFSGINVFDGLSSNADGDLPFPIGTYSDAPTSSFFIEDFEDETLTYSANPMDDLSEIANGTYFGRINSMSGLPSSVVYNNLQGDGFYGAEDTDDFPNNETDLITLDFDDINITDRSMIEFCVFLAEDQSGTSEHWDTNTSVRFGYDVDNSGTFIQLFAVESSGANNTAPAIDTNGDGIGDGAEITNIFTQYCFSIPETGDLIDLKVEIDKLNNAMEDIAIDNIALMGEEETPPPPPPVDPIPTMGQWALFILGLLITNLGLVFMYNERKEVA